MKTRYCDCGETQTAVIPFANHVYLDGKCIYCNDTSNNNGDPDCKHENILVLEEKKPTCTEPGLTEGAICSDCGMILWEQMELPAEGHNFKVIAPAVDPTCEEWGKTEEKECVVCGEHFEPQSIKPYGHKEVTDKAVAATCTSTGLTEGKHCSVCGKVTVAQETVAMKSHTEVIDAAVAATCTSTGLTEGKHCSVCGKVTVAQRTVAMKAHTEVIDEAVEATCISTGLTEGKHCSKCNKVLVAQVEIPKLGHTVQVMPAITPTCNKTGLTEGQKCATCGEILVAQNSIPALPHTEVIDAAVASTCTSTGLTEGKHCSVCGKVTVAQATVAMKSHTEIIDAAVAATCTSTGLTEGKHCSVCGKVTVAQATVAMKSHTEVIDAAIAATCTSTGLTEGKHCSTCDKVFVEQKVLPIIDCIESEWIIDAEPTVTEDGSYHTVCTMCGKTMVESKILYATGSLGLKYSLNSDKQSYSVVGIGSCKDLDIVIPKFYNELPVTSVGNSAFTRCTSLTSVTIGDSVTSIGQEAFYNCTSLTSVTIGNSVTSIGNDAFRNCNSLIEVCNKSSLNIAAGSSYAGYYAKHIITDESQSAIKYVGDYIFYDDGNDVYLVKYIGKDNEITLPEYEGGKEYDIWQYAFYSHTSLYIVTIPDSVTSIGQDAFLGCSELTFVTIGDSVTSIGKSAFYNCPWLSSLTMGNSVTSIGDYAFRDCSSLTSVTIGDSVTSIGYGAFRSCSSLTSVTIGNSVTSIGDYAFRGCSSLTSITIPDSVTSIGDYALGNCPLLDSVIYGGTLEQWQAISKGDGWNGSSSEHIYTNYSVAPTCSEKGYTRYICYHCDYTYTDNYVDALGHSFANYVSNNDATCSTDGTKTGVCTVCGATDTITDESNKAYGHIWSDGTCLVPGSCIECGTSNNVFGECQESDWIIGAPATETETGYKYTKCTVCGKVMSEEIIDMIISGSEGLKFTLNSDGKSYSVSKGTCTDTNIVIPPSYNGLPVTSISSYAFQNYTSLTSVTIPDSVTSIGAHAFQECNLLTSVTIPDSVTSIGEAAFEGCYSLVEVCNKSLLNITVGSINYGSVGRYAKHIIKDESQSAIKYVGDYIFYDDGNEVYLVKYIGNDTEIALPEYGGGKQYSIYELAFSNCYWLSSVTIPDSVTGIGDYAFQYCSSLISIIIPDSVTSIGYGAFYGCRSLTSVTFNNTQGWWRASYSSATSGTDIPSTDLADPATAAKYLTSSYYSYYWNRTE